MCPECGGGNTPDADRCGQCGADLSLLAARSRSLVTMRRAGPYRMRPLVGLVIGILLILPLAASGYIEAESNLRLEPLPLVVALALAIAGFEVLLRVVGRDPQQVSERVLRGTARKRRAAPSHRDNVRQLFKSEDG